MNDWILPITFFAIAFFYSSIGFGGGSSYLAILSLVLSEFYEIRTLALIFNLSVVSIGTFVFIKNRVFSWPRFWPFLVFSIPMAFLGTQLRLSETSFFLILGSSLIFSAVFMGLQMIGRSAMDRMLSWRQRGALGASVGLISGVAGIGGGIFLSPLLNLLGWANPRSVASLASIFILFNSASGLIGLVASDSFQLNIEFAIPLLCAVVAGGTLGSYLSNSKFNVHVIRGLTALLVFYVGLRILMLHGFGIKL